MDIPNAQSIFRKTLPLDIIKVVAAETIRNVHIRKPDSTSVMTLSETSSAY